jgi:2-C-methyl-D-erythritol 2,4-cyclodiphosphate synthase
MQDYRVGIGQDSHRFTDKIKPLILAGILFANEQGVEANSDGDVILHALCNALASSVGKGSLSTYADKTCLEQGIKDSREYAKVAYHFVRDAGYRVNNVSIAIEAKKPKLEKRFPEMKKSIANLLEIEADDVGITATSGEGLTDFGKGLGIQVFACISIVK